MLSMQYTGDNYKYTIPIINRLLLHFHKVLVRLSGEALQRVQNKPLLYFASCCAEVRIKNCARDYNTLAELAKTYTGSLRVRTPLRICPFG